MRALVISALRVAHLFERGFFASVGYAHKCEAMWRRGRAGGGAVATFENRLDIWALHFSAAHFD